MQQRREPQGQVVPWSLAFDQPAQLVERGIAEGLRLHSFKRSEPLLPRVRRVLGILKALGPRSLLDIGSGRGAALWPIVEALPETRVVACDTAMHHLREIRAVHEGGIGRLQPLAMDVTTLALAPHAVDVVTILEVLEHLSDPGRAARQVVAAARDFVVASVPSTHDDNPQHVNRFSAADLERLFTSGGATKVQCTHVLNHLVAVVTK